MECKYLNLKTTFIIFYIGKLIVTESVFMERGKIAHFTVLVPSLPITRSPMGGLNEGT